ncbi:MAG: DUF2065 domain-containing protein [Desulfohalobiaceae bacterium]
MQSSLGLFLTALGLALILEGLPYFLFAERMPEVLRLLAEKGPSSLRRMAVLVILLGLLLIYLGRG